MYRDQRWVLSVALALLSIAAGCVSATSGSGNNTGDAAGSGVAADADEDSAAIADTLQIRPPMSLSTWCRTALVQAVVSPASPAPRTMTVPPTSALPSPMMERGFALRPAFRTVIAMWMRTAWSCRVQMRSGSA